MSIPYVPPGVISVTEAPVSGMIPPGATPVVPGLIGEASGQELNVETTVITPDGVELVRSGIIDIINVTKTTTRETISPLNYARDDVSPSGGVILGDSRTTIAQIAAPDVDDLSVSDVGGGPLDGDYRYTFAWVFTDEYGGVDEDNVVEISVQSKTVVIDGFISLDNSHVDPASGDGLTGIAIYRSKSLGSTPTPRWGPWYKVGEVDLMTDTFSDNMTDNDSLLEPTALPGLSDGDSIRVQYSFADPEYYEPTHFTSLNDVIAKYGAPFDVNGDVSSELSLAANLAYANGANIIICVALPKNYNISQLNLAFKKLEEEPDVTLVACSDGSSDALSLLNAHVNTCNAKNYFRVGLAGRDGVKDNVSVQEKRNNAQAIGSKYIQLYSPSVVQYRNSISRQKVDIGGQYIASAMAGFYASHRPHETATRRTIAGLIGIADTSTLNEKNVDAQNGLTVVEDRGGVLRIRHSISTDRSSIDHQEFSVTIAQNDMITDIIRVIDDAIIGKIIADDLAPTKITGIFSNVLDRKVRAQSIVSYAGLSAEPVAGDPTTFNVDWTYRPTYYVNNLNINFSIDLATGELSIGDLIGSTGIIL